MVARCNDARRTHYYPPGRCILIPAEFAGDLLVCNPKAGDLSVCNPKAGDWAA